MAHLGPVTAGLLVASLMQVPDVSAQAPAVPPIPHFSVSVTAEADIVEWVGTTRRIGASEIRLRRARTLDETLRLLPGIYVRTGGEGTPRVDLRGLRSRHVLLLVDGVPVNSTSDGQFDPTQFPTEFMRQVKISYTNSSLLYGENAMAGAIEIETEQPRPGLHGAVDVDLRRPDQRNGSLRISGGREKLSFLLTGSAFASDGFRLPHGFQPSANEDGGLRANSDRARNTALAKVGYALSDRVKLGTLLTIGNGSHGLPPSTADDPADPFAQRTRYERVEAYRTVTGQISLGYLPSGPFNLRGWAYVNGQAEERARYDDDTYSSIESPFISGTFRQREETQVSGGAVHGRYDLSGAGRLRFAANGRREQFATAGVIRDVEVGGSTGSGSGRGGGAASRRFDLRSFDDRRHLDVYSLGAEWEFRPLARTGVVLGYSRSWQQRLLANGDAGSSWLAGVTHSLTNELNLRASVTHKIRFPSIRQLYEEDTGNPTLAPERSYGAEIGVDRRWRADSELSVTGFWMRADNFIERDDGELFTNRDRYRFTGVEVAVATRAISPLDLRAAYSFLDTADLSPGSGREELQNRPRHRITCQTRWELPAGFHAQAALYHVADQVYYSRRAPLAKAHADDYTIADVGLGKALSDRYDITLGVDNVFDQLYEESYALPREGRTVVLRLRALF